jgi:hypothetical protein
VGSKGRSQIKLRKIRNVGNHHKSREVIVGAAKLIRGSSRGAKSLLAKILPSPLAKGGGIQGEGLLNNLYSHI